MKIKKARNLFTCNSCRKVIHLFNSVSILQSHNCLNVFWKSHNKQCISKFWKSILCIIYSYNYMLMVFSFFLYMVPIQFRYSVKLIKQKHFGTLIRGSSDFENKWLFNPTMTDTEYKLESRKMQQLAKLNPLRFSQQLEFNIMWILVFLVLCCTLFSFFRSCQFF